MKAVLKSRTNLIKCIYSAVVGGAFQLSFRLPSDLVTQIILIFISGLLFSIPFIINVQTIKIYRVEGIKGFIISDMLFAFAPAVISAVFAEVVYILFKDIPDYSKGMGSIMFIAIALLLMLCFWLGYLLTNAIYKRLDEDD